MKNILIVLLSGLILTQCNFQKQGKETQADVKLSDEGLMTLVQEQTFRYFWDGAEPVSGLARERIHMDGNYPRNDKNVVTSGGSGFGIMAILVGIEREFITPEQGLERFEKIMGWLEKSRPLPWDLFSLAPG